MLMENEAEQSSDALTSAEIYALFRAQDKYLKFSDFLEHNIEFYYVDTAESAASEEDNG